MDFFVDLEHLEILNLSMNPVSADFNEELYRPRVLYRLNRLANLDGTPVTADDKVEAMNAMGDDLEHREEVHAEHIPTEPFVNLRPPYEEPSAEELAMAAARHMPQEISTDGFDAKTETLKYGGGAG